MIAKASGNPDAMLLGLLVGIPVASSDLEDARPLKCIDSTVPESAPEKLCQPKNFVVRTMGGSPPPELPDPRNAWITLTYHMTAGPNGRIDIYSGRRFVARVQGSIGAAVANPGAVKFKIGHYRSKIPGSAHLDVDRFCLSEDVQVCAPDLVPVSN
jgi:hypothetical protein